MQWLDDLNAEQRLAATATDGPVLIVAGPGTGKTKTLTARIAYLIAAGHARPEQILALTFTKKAAEEMQARVRALLGEGAQPLPQISTFHALCHKVLSGLGGELAFVTEAERLRIIKTLTRPAVYKRHTVREIGLLISRYKNQAEQDTDVHKMVIAYDAALAEQQRVDFDDLLVRTKQLLQSDEPARQALQARYTYILVDEFQDTNMLQYELLRLLLGHTNVFVIGDPNQSIYGFRGASGTIFDQFRADYPALTAVTLHVNYRSAPAIVATGNAVFAQGPQLQAHRTRNGKAIAVEVLNEFSEANWIINTIHAAVGGGDFMHAVSDNQRDDEYTLRDFAILYRNRAAASAVYKAIAASGLPYQVVGDGSPYDAPDVQKIIAVLRAFADTTQPDILGRAAPDSLLRGVDIQAVQSLIGAEDRAPSVIAAKASTVLGLASPELQHFNGTLVRFQTAGEATRYIDVIAEQDFYDPSADAITLLTIHASKGLEFPYVFLVGAEEGLLPYTSADVNEERRLFYVAVTRARDMLAVLHTRRRGSEVAALSSFAQSIPPSVLARYIDPQLQSDQRRAHKRAVKRSQQSLF
jgi:superfamily I DNA/RNA helicase